MKERGVAQQFSIKDLEHFTGVKSHTIRAWEQRYKLLVPKRTATNIRYYSGDDLKKLLNVSYLMYHGMKISKIAELGDEALIDVLYLPEREIHDISLLFIHFLCRKYQIRSVFLGASVPFSDLMGVAEQFPNARFVSYCTTYPASSEAQSYVNLVTSEFEGLDNKFLLAGKVFEGCTSNDVVTTVTNGEDLMKVLFD